MKSTNKSDHDPELAKNFRVSDYEAAREARKRELIANAIQGRFLERYIRPVSQSEKKHGFAIMAVSCLMIEALESFRRGWKTSKGKSEDAFCSFFDTVPPFSVFKGHMKDFYTNVRCGILHEAETRGGWKIQRTGPLFDTATHTINATRFIETLERYLRGYCDDLKTKYPWDSADWKRVIVRMDAIVENCKTQ